MKLDLYAQSGEKKGVVEASDMIFGAPIKDEVLRLGILRQLANARQSNAHTKTRGEVRGGGKKPYRQKGTGRARQGSSRSPVWKGGGVTFGPRSIRNHTQAMNKKAFRTALFSGLSQKASEKAVFALEKYESKTPKTKNFVALLGKLPAHRSLLVILDQPNEGLIRSARNIPTVKLTPVGHLNLHDILSFDKVMFLEAALKKAEALFIKK